MGRNRKLAGDDILATAERVALREGAAGMTLEAIATDACVGKATILYEYKTMNGLVVALVRYLLDREAQRLAEMQDALAGEPDVGIRARIAASDRQFSENERSLVTMIMATLAGDPELKRAVRDFFARSVEEVCATATAPRGALVAFLALHGLTNLQALGLFEWPQDDFRRLLDDIGRVASRDPDTQSASA